ncbi:histidine phosphatase family protein [Alsobacter sp. SYSU M60028]|uniref:Histidine phosphatase family protein n=1 Tax=Alsobacter ponti TaxID=2962936 RepID=A0ABT1LAM6_9HYPH|nr:histidine phosphatase family protein [Alsobacter ponti]MCP8937308.1 histidine phosphatase family protein [Alsobacter ponti]
MRRLIIFRHAKAVPHGAAPDFDRALAQRGLDDAEAMGRMMAEEQLLPDLALVSPALRTRQTWERAAPALGPVETREEAAIYNAETDDLLRLVREAPAKVRTLVLVGHNPGVSDLARRLVGHGDRYAFARLRKKFPTAAIAVIDFPEDWPSVADGAGRLDRFVAPEGAVD